MGWGIPSLRAFFLKFLGEMATYCSVFLVMTCGEKVGKQNIVSGRKIDMFMEEDMQVNHNTATTPKKLPSTFYLSGEASLSV